MKGIVVDIDKEYAIILNKKGDFKKIHKIMPQWSIGDEIEVPDNMLTSHFLLRQIFSTVSTRRIAAAVIAFVLLLGMGGYAIADYFSPAAFVTIDINPSIELILNRYERVLRVEALDDEGSILAKDAGAFKNMKLEEAMSMLVDRAQSENYLKESSALMFTVSARQSRVTQDVNIKIKQLIRQKNGKLQAETKRINQVKAPIQIIMENTSIEKHEEAKKMKISQGKLLMYEKLKKTNPAISLEDVKKASISTIIEELKKSKAGMPADGKKGRENEQKGADGTERFDGKDVRKDEDIKIQQNRKNEKNQNVEKDKKQSKNDDKNHYDEKDNTGEDKIGETNSISDNSGAESESLHKEIKKDISDTFEKIKDKLNGIQKSGGNGDNKKEKKK